MGLGNAFAPTILSNTPSPPNPVGVTGPAGDIFTIMAFGGVVLIAATGLAAIVSLAVRYRRARTAERAQLKWLLYAGALIVAALLAEALVEQIIGPGAATGNLQNAVLSGAVALVPVAIGIAVLRYRLYDIDRVISRTLAYAIITGLLAGVYAGLVLLATQVFRVHTPVAVAAATLAAALFNPVRRRVQKGVDRRFNRARYDADQTWPHSLPGSKTLWTWTPSVMTWPVSCTRPWNPPTYRCGSASTTEAGFIGVAANQSRPGWARHHSFIRSSASSRSRASSACSCRVSSCSSRTRRMPARFSPSALSALISASRSMSRREYCRVPPALRAGSSSPSRS